LLLPGAQIRWEMHLHAVGEQIRDHVELAIYLYPKARFRNIARSKSVRPSPGAPGVSTFADTVVANQTYQVLRQPRARKFSAAHALAGQAMAMEAILPDAPRRY